MFFRFRYLVCTAIRTVKCACMPSCAKTKKYYVSYVFFCSAQEGIHALDCTQANHFAAAIFSKKKNCNSIKQRIFDSDTIKATRKKL